MSSPGGGSAPRAGIVGIGLVGGSLGLALRARGWFVTGDDLDAERVSRALAIGALDATGRDATAEITFICTPAADVAAAARSHLAALDEAGTPGVVTDVAGVKAAVVAAVDDARFIGGHPMAGSELEGLDGADGTLFEGATWVLTPVAGTDEASYGRLSDVVRSLGAEVLALPPERHDALVAQVSHVPHLVAATLMNLAAEAARSQGALLRLAAGGFRDMTRVAAGHPGIWPDICAQNAAAIDEVLGRLVEQLARLRSVVDAGDREALLDLLTGARAARARLPSPATRPEELVEVRVAVADRPGVVAEVATLLGELGVNLENLEIVHSPEGDRGVLVLVVRRQAADRVRRTLAAHGHRPTSAPGSAPPADPGTFRVCGGVPLRGRLRVPGDKSISHRALLLGALAQGESVVRGLSSGEDVARTAAAVSALGARVESDGDVTRVAGGRLHEAEQIIDVGNSGTTLRLLAGVCAGLDGAVTVLTGDESIRRRPLHRVVDPLRAMGAELDAREGGRRAPLVVRGAKLQGIDYVLPVPSAQVKSAVLLAGLGADGPTSVHETIPTRAHTEELLATCGADVAVERTASSATVRLNPSRLRPLEVTVPGDPSAAAFWVVAACIVEGSEVTVADVYQGPGRAGFLEVLDRMGADVDRLPGGALQARHGRLRATTIGGAEVPALIDELPVLAVAAAVAEGVTVVRDARELRVKESDRIATMVEGLSAMGVEIEATDDGFVIRGGPPLRGASVRSHGDHRVAMALAVAGLAAAGDTVVEGWDAVATSYPGFERDLAGCRTS